MVKFLSTLVTLIALVCFGNVTGIFWNDFRVTYNVNPLGHFNRIPKTAGDAFAEGWMLINSDCKNNGDYLGFRLMIPGDNSIVLLLDLKGIIAGIQVLLPYEEVLQSPNNTFRYGDVPYFNNETIDGKEYFVVTAYIVDPEIICTTGRNETDLEIGGTGQGVWVQNGPTPTKFLEIPDSREDALTSGWSDNNCFPGMGVHSWYKMEDYEETNCEVQTPVFGMWNKGSRELHGFGFAAPGLAINPRFEHPPTAMISIVIGPLAPPCLYDQRNAIGTTNLHVYFVDNPWLITC